LVSRRCTPAGKATNLVTEVTRSTWPVIA
jgi:hypothetical protein